MTAARTGVVGADHQNGHAYTPVQITVRNAEAVRDELAARAVLAHKSMQEYFRHLDAGRR